MAKSHEADIGVIALEDAGIYAWLGALDGKKNVIAQQYLPEPIRWDDIGYSVAAVNEVIADLLSADEWGSVKAVGFSAFGQIDRREKTLVSVPREEWKGEKFPIEFGNLVRKTLGTKVSTLVEHDVTACARAEWRYGEHNKTPDNQIDTRLFGYVRVGAGIGVEIFIDGMVLHETRRGESGHIPIYIDPRVDKLDKSTCWVHPHCLEGYASARALAKRKLSEAERNDLLGNYIGQLIAALTMFTLPFAVVLTGTSMLNSDGSPNGALYDRVRDRCRAWLGNYPAYEQREDLKKYIRPATMRVERAAITGTADLLCLDLPWDRR